MKYKIVTDLKILCQKSTSATEEEAKTLIKDLEDSLDLKKGVGLSAIQIGINKQVAIVRLPNMKIDIVNPVIINKGEKFRFEKEGCLSIPLLYIDTTRYYKFSFVSQGILYNLSGLDAICAEHEIDHGNGLTILNRKWRKK